MSEKYASWVTLRPQWYLYRRGEAEVRIFNFKTKWSELSSCQGPCLAAKNPQQFLIAFFCYYRREPTIRSVYNVECTSIGAAYNEIIIIGDEHHHK